jgi:uncharacterized caspase-like protein
MKAPDNSLVVFATAPGEAAPAGPQGSIRPLTRALIANIAAPGIEIQRAMTKVRAELSAETRRRQMPLGHNNLSGEVHLSPANAPAPSPEFSRLRRPRERDCVWCFAGRRFLG